jgi:glycosyltransferase involved in cell wall biosynthesis
MKISVVIPIYNAQKIILNSYKILKEKLEDIGYDYEILFRDDASTDESKNILEGISKTNPRVKIFSHLPNRGLGFTLRRLFSDASGDIVIYLDIDLPFGIEILPCLIQEIKKADVVLASKYAGLSSRIPLSRKISSRLYYQLCKILFDINTQDLGSSLVIFRRKVLQGIFILSNGFDIHIELFTKIKRKGFSIKEIPARYTYNGYSTFSILRHGPAILIDTLKFWVKNR